MISLFPPLDSICSSFNMILLSSFHSSSLSSLFFHFPFLPLFLPFFSFPLLSSFTPLSLSFTSFAHPSRSSSSFTFPLPSSLLQISSPFPLLPPSWHSFFLSFIPFPFCFLPRYSPISLLSLTPNFPFFLSPSLSSPAFIYQELHRARRN